MKNNISHRYFFGPFLLLLFCIQSFAETTIPLKVAVITGQAPHIYLQNKEIRGEEGQSLNAAFIKAGFAPDYEYYPSLRAIERMNKGLIDATINVKEESLPSAYKSTFFYTFNNCAVTKTSRKLTLTQIKDFQNLRVVAFKNAQVSLNLKQPNDLVRFAKSYQEIQDVEARIRLLNADRTDVMLTEKTIFLYYLEKFRLGSAEDYDFHCFFEPTKYHLFFRLKEHRDLFDKIKKQERTPARASHS